MTPSLAHILVLDVVGRARASQDVMRRSQAILLELLSACPSYEVHRGSGEALTFSEESRLVVLFLADAAAPVRCALELWELVQELPSMLICLGIHSGSVSMAAEGGAPVAASGEGMDEVRSLVKTGKHGDIMLSQSYAESLKHLEEFASQINEEDGDTAKRYRIEPQKLVLVDAEAGESEGFRAELESALHTDGHETFSPSRGKVDLAWARAVEDKIRSADTVVALVSESGSNSDFLRYQLEVAADEQRKRGRPFILPVRLGTETESGDLALAAGASRSTNNLLLISEVRTALASGIREEDPEALITAGGAAEPTSKFYVHRPADDEFEQALARRESIVLVKGPRQIGKTSLIASGIETVNQRGWRSLSTDFQKLSARQLKSETEFYRVLATSLSRELDFEYDFESEWVDAFGPNMNMDGFMRSLVGASELPLVWFIDEADRLFTAPFASEFFALIRSWHNARATDRRGPWRRLTIVIGYATEAHLFIKDLNQSPFNVGCALPMTMFTFENTLALNERYGRPIERQEDVQELHSLLGGQPFLTRRAFDVLVQRKMDLKALIATAHRDEGPFADHLKRVLVSVSHLPFVWEALRTSFESTAFPESDGLHRLVAAGILVRNSQRGYDLPSELYMRYLARFVHKDWEPRS